MPPVLEHPDSLLAAHGREVLEELIEREPGLEIFDQCIDGNPRPAEDECTADDGRIGSGSKRARTMAAAPGAVAQPAARRAITGTTTVARLRRAFIC